MIFCRRRAALPFHFIVLSIKTYRLYGKLFFLVSFVCRDEGLVSAQVASGLIFKRRRAPSNREPTAADKTAVLFAGSVARLAVIHIVIIDTPLAFCSSVGRNGRSGMLI